MLYAVCDRCTNGDYGDYDCYYDCRSCRKIKESEDIFHVICDAIPGNYSMDIHLIRIIAGYSIGVSVQCSNATKQCQTEIHFDTKHDYDYFKCDDEDYSMRIWQSIDVSQPWRGIESSRLYLDHPNFMYAYDEGTYSIFGQLTRIFCSQCSHELEFCPYCYSHMVRGTRCPNYHTFAKCTICDRLHVDSYADIFAQDCAYCKQVHCIGCLCEKGIKIKSRETELEKLYVEYEDNVDLVLKEFNQSKYKNNKKSKSKRSVTKPGRRKDRRENVKSKRKFQRRYQMSLHY